MNTLKNLFNPKSVANNKAAFAELPGSSAVKTVKTKAIQTTDVLADSAAVRDGKYVAKDVSNASKKAAAKANAAAFAELPTQAAVTAPKAKPISVEDILADSLAVREGYTAPASLGKNIKNVLNKISSAAASLLGAIVGGLKAIKNGIVSGAKAIFAFMISPYTKLVDAKANKVAFVELPGQDAIVLPKAKQPAVEDILADSLLTRTQVFGKSTDTKYVGPSTKENLAAFAELPGALASEAKPGKSAAYKEMVAANNASLRKLTQANLATKNAVDKSFVLPELGKTESLTDALSDSGIGFEGEKN